ncbi:hypothetical protein KH5_19810 [Urechidicola sp. KH5]
MYKKFELYKLKQRFKRKLKREFEEFKIKFSLLITKPVLSSSPSIDEESKPKVLNLNIIDSCNSKCVMCNIWKRDESLEITPEQLKEILSNELFDSLEHIGVTGGEPTLREDLPEIFEKIIEAIPHVKGLSTITNAIIEEDVKTRIEEVKAVCDRFSKPFSVMVSLDGLGKSHDNVRGTKGNFKTAINVINYLKNELSVPVSFGCTISKINVWDVDDLLFYVKQNGIYGRFRVAETINRLYNHDRGKVIRNFDEDETYQLLIFFEKLKSNYENNETYKRTYSSIQNVLKGGTRLIGCPYHNDGVVLGSKGQLSYCAPKSKEIGNALDNSAIDIYRNQIKEKQRILAEDCANCIHDYHAPITPNEINIKNNETYFRKYLSIEKAEESLRLSKWVGKEVKNKNVKRVFIFGWYGTETVGDKAILGGIINHYKEHISSEIEFVIGSIYPFVTERTCLELNIEARVVSTSNFDLIKYAKSSDIIVMGGGPLMDLEHLYIPLIGFKIAKKYKKKTVVFGCGLGPLKFDIYRNAVKEILDLADEVILRDENSIEFAKKIGINRTIKNYGDPAMRYVLANYDKIEIDKENVLSCFLRDWTFEYFDRSKEEFELVKERFELGLAELIKSQASKLKVDRIEFHHMHNFVIGNDDRDFSRYFINRFFENDPRVSFNKKLSTVENICTSMKKSRMNICMRFHSVLFADTLNTNFIAIDYTLGGKIHGYLKDNQQLLRKKTIDEMIEMANKS